MGKLMGRWEKHVGYSVCSHQFYMFVRLKVGYPPQLWPCHNTLFLGIHYFQANPNLDMMIWIKV